MTTFNFHPPMPPASTRSAPPSVSGNGSSAPDKKVPETVIRMLVVEDDFLFVEQLQRHLRVAPRARFEIEHAASLSEAIACLSAGRFDMVLLDLSLPDSPRESTLERFIVHAPTLPVVIISGHDDEDLALQSLQAGAQDYFVKGQSSLPLLPRVIHHAIERKRLEVSLLEREAIYRLITENARDLITVLDREGRRIYVSPSYARLLGDVSELRGTNSLSNVHPDDAERVREILQETVATGVGQRGEYRFVCRDGTIRHIESQGSVVKDQNGQVSRVVVVSRDVTERKEAEESLRAGEQRYRQLLDSVTDYIYNVALNERGDVTATRHNASCVAVTGYTPEDFAGNPGLGITMVPAEDRAAVEEQIAGARRGLVTKPFEHRLRHRDGSIRWVRATIVPHRDTAGRVTSYDGLVSDVTERHLADDRVRQSELLYHSLVTSLPQCIMRKNREGKFIFVNQRFAEMLHTEPAAVIGKTDFDFYPAEMARKFRADDQRVMASGQLYETEEQNLTSNGVLHDVHVMKIPVCDQEGEVTGMQCIFWDVTAARQAQREIQRREELLQAIMDHTPAVIYMKDRDGRYLYINHEFERLFKLKRERTVARTDFDIFPPEVAQRFQENDRTVLEAGQPRMMDEQAPHADGLHDYLTVKFPLLDPTTGRPNAVCGISTDITDRKRIEQKLQQRNRDLQRALGELGDARIQLIQTEKLRAVGTLAAGVAHEVKNPLQTLTLSLDGLVRSHKDADELTNERYGTMREAICRADKIIRALLDYARPDPLNLALHDINEAVEHSLELLRYQLLDARVKVTAHYDRYAPQLMLDKQKLEHVFVNLLTNSVQAMERVPEKNRRIQLKIATEFHSDGHPTPQSLGDTTCWIPGDPLVVIELSDSGPGIPESALPQVFDPFFTTKGPGKGTGLGLHIVQNIIVLHGGTIELSNRPEGGALVRITFNPTKGRKHHEKKKDPRRR